LTKSLNNIESGASVLCSTFCFILFPEDKLPKVLGLTGVKKKHVFLMDTAGNWSAVRKVTRMPEVRRVFSLSEQRFDGSSNWWILFQGCRE
jgi:hypothetical protein